MKLVMSTKYGDEKSNHGVTRAENSACLLRRRAIQGLMKLKSKCAVLTDDTCRTLSTWAQVPDTLPETAHVGWTHRGCKDRDSYCIETLETLETRVHLRHM
jgi:hypothetical protein